MVYRTPSTTSWWARTGMKVSFVMVHEQQGITHFLMIKLTLTKFVLTNLIWLFIFFLIVLRSFSTSMEFRYLCQADFWLQKENRGKKKRRFSSSIFHSQLDFWFQINYFQLFLQPVPAFNFSKVIICDMYRVIGSIGKENIYEIILTCCGINKSHF